ncbi:MAG: hypothetical protein A4E52_00526 [Pelotomaculum sp. PtaB.Bin013]|nr:MAG: hypothetical protein A4E52_00526 [Pelotomaculum sp. PtaB.Bin013]
MIKRKTIIFVTLAILMFICMPAVASANAFVGGAWTSSSSNIIGVKCDIYTAAYGVLNSPHFTCAWPMVYVTGTSSWAQVG